MENKPDFTLTLTSTKTPTEVFDLVLEPRRWWQGFYGEIFEGDTDTLNAEFTFLAADGAHYTRQRVVELDPGRKLTWLITESRLSFVDTMDEWTGTKIHFDISENGTGSQLVFTHEGLTQDFECYESCAPAWTEYLQNNLFPLLNNN